MKKKPLYNKDTVCIYMEPPHDAWRRRVNNNLRHFDGIALYRIDDYVFTLGYKTGRAGVRLIEKLFKSIGLDVYSKDIKYAVDETIFVMCNKKQKFSFILKHGPCPKD